MVFAILLWIAIRYKHLQLYVFLLAVLCFRMGFNWYILEPRAKKYQEMKDLSQQIVDITKGQKLFILGESYPGNFDGMSFHIATGRNEVLKISGFTDTAHFYIAGKKQLQGKQYKTYVSFTNIFADDSLRAFPYTSKHRFLANSCSTMGFG